MTTPSSQASALVRALDAAVSWTVGSCLAAALAVFCAATSDRALRQSWSGVDAVAHDQATLALAAPWIAGMAMVLSAAVFSVALLRRFLRPSMARMTLLAGSAAVATAAAMAILQPTCASAKSATLVRWGAPTGSAALGVGAAAVAALVYGGLTRAARGKHLHAAAAAALLGLTGGLLLYGDLTVYPALYTKLHEVVEVAALTCLCGAVLVAVETLHRASPAARWCTGALVVTVALQLWVVTVPASEEASNAKPTGDDTEAPSSGERMRLALQHVWREPGYVDRWVGRSELLDAYLDDPHAWQGAEEARMERFRKRFDIRTVSLAHRWTAPPPLAAEQARQLTAARGDRHDLNVVIYYVDTLRADVAHDPRVMPELARFAAGGLDFRRAYSTASDTVGAVPVMTGGNYFDAERRGDLLELARRESMRNALIIPESASRFLASQLPRFRFDERLEVPDHSPDKRVWGYGADRSTAEAIVDRGLDWLARNHNESHLLWLFNFDVHAWRELDDAHLEKVGAHLPGRGTKRWRYEAAAAGVDRAFGRFVRELEARKLERDTIVVFVSDHGEALGQGGHWVHAVYLWESLVHVPMVVRIPGVAPKRIERPVGHVDLAPTLAPYISPRLRPDRAAALYHGHDLLAHTLPAATTRRLPLLMYSMRKNDLLRVAIVKDDDPFKLVMTLAAPEPTLHDLRVHAPDDADVVGAHRATALGLLSDLVRSPVFPRADGDPGRRLALQH